MDVNWIIQDYVRDSSSTELAEAVEKAGFNLIHIKSDYSRSLIKDLDGKCVLFNGSIQMAKIIKKDLPNSSPVIYSNNLKYLCQNYYPRFVNYLFNDNVIWTSLEQFRVKKWLYYSMFGKEGMIFIRPDCGEKPFQAQLLDIQDVDRFYEKNKDLANNLVVLSTPKNIFGEWRVIVSKKVGVIALSCYQYQGLVTKVPGAPDNVYKLAEEMLNKIDYDPDSVFCYDICQDNDEKPWLLELTSFSSAGLYAAKKDRIVDEVSKIAWEDFKNRAL